jgi:alkylhydroperoxidase/carboxymuconolactone decarboxylase family protein YurZ
MAQLNGQEQALVRAYEDLRHRRGLDVLRAMGADGHPKLKAMDEEFWRITVGQLFGEVFTRPGLSLRDRELVTMAALIALFRIDALDLHLRAAPSVGITDDEIRELILQVTFYAGWATGAYALQKHKAVLADMAGPAEAGQ